jgi:polyisoprenoid-binding protein YceI
MLVILMAFGIAGMVMAKDVYKTDISGTKVEWIGKKVTGEHKGTIALKSGTLLFEEGKLVGGEYIIDMNSIVDLDLTDPKWNEKLVGHLKSDDFFSVGKFPFAQFVITEVKSYTPKDNSDLNNAQIKGDLTIKGITNSVTFPAQVSLQNNQATATGKVVLDRTKWDIRYGSGKFFESLGDKMIYDDFTITVNLVAVK